MNYFDGLHFPYWASIPEYGDSIIKEFSSALHQDWYALQFNYSGTLRYAFGHGRYALEERPCAWVTVPVPGFKYRYGVPKGQHRSHHYVCFAGPRTQQYVEKGLLPKAPPTKPTLVTRPDDFLLQMRNLHDLIERRATEQAVNRLEGLLVDLHFQPSTHCCDKVTTGIEHLAQQMTLHPERNWDLEEEAERLGISYAHFRRVFRTTMRCPPAKHLRHARLAKAHTLLLENDAPVARIAEAVAIPNVYYFTRVFTARYRLPPARYRQLALESRDD